jgi:hypothetical protein
MSAKGTRCGIHNLELEEVRPGKWLCPEPECTHITTDAMAEKVREMLWAQEHGMVHPEAMIIGGEGETR